MAGLGKKNQWDYSFHLWSSFWQHPFKKNELNTGSVTQTLTWVEMLVYFRLKADRATHHPPEPKCHPLSDYNTHPVVQTLTLWKQITVSAKIACKRARAEREEIPFTVPMQRVPNQSKTNKSASSNASQASKQTFNISKRAEKTNLFRIWCLQHFQTQTLQQELNSTVTLLFEATLDFWERGKKEPPGS